MCCSIILVQGGPELMCMQMQLERLFQQGEQERIRQENVEKQQAEQVAAGELEDMLNKSCDNL